MARLREDPDVAAREALLQEIRVKRAVYNVKQSELADVLDIGGPRMSALLKRPEELTAGRLRAIVRRLRLEPGVVLAFMGYSQKDLKELAKRVLADGS